MSEVVNNMEKHRYELEVDGAYRCNLLSISGRGSLSSRTPKVPPELEGKGIGSELVKGALDQVRADKFRASAQLPLRERRGWKKHPDYADLLRPNL